VSWLVSHVGKLAKGGFSVIQTTADLLLMLSENSMSRLSRSAMAKYLLPLSAKFQTGPFNGRGVLESTLRRSC
jgi:hypothetical protein